MRGTYTLPHFSHAGYMHQGSAAPLNSKIVCKVCGIFELQTIEKTTKFQMNV